MDFCLALRVLKEEEMNTVNKRKSVACFFFKLHHH